MTRKTDSTVVQPFPPRELADSKHLPLYLAWRAEAKKLGFDLDRLSMDGLYSLHQGLSAVSYMVTAMINQPCLTPDDEDTEDRAGNMLETFLSKINGTLSAITTTAAARKLDEDADPDRKFYLAAHGYIDGLSDPSYGVAKVAHIAAHIREPLEA